MKRKQWTMPGWMEPYRELIHNTGGNSVEKLMNDHATTVQVNAPLALICVAVQSQVSLLCTLAKEGRLVEKEKP